MSKDKLFNSEEIETMLSATRDKMDMIDKEILKLDGEKKKCQKIIAKLIQGE